MPAATLRVRTQAAVMAIQKQWIPDLGVGD